MNEFVVAAAQFESIPGDVEANLALALEGVRTAVERGARLVVLPEAALSGYALDRDEMGPAAIEADGQALDTLARLGVVGDATIVVGFLEHAAGRFYNAAATIVPGRPPVIYRKAHLPRMGIDRYVEPGDRPFAVVDTPVGPLGTLICYDLRFPEPARVLALSGAGMIAAPSAWPASATDYPEFLLRARASENRLLIVAADQCGTGRGVTFLGRSQVVRADGAVVAEAGAGAQVLTASFGPESVAAARRVAGSPDGPAGLLADRRPELYRGLDSRTNGVLR